MRKRQNNKIIILTFVALLFLLASGCKKKEAAPPPPQPAPNVKQEKKPVPPVQQQHSSVNLTANNVPPAMDFSKRKDPFKPFGIEVKPQASPIFNKGPGYGLLPIQNYEVGQFRVLGIIAGLKQNSALIVDPAGKAYVVKPGMDIGKNGGRIEKISTNAIEILERYRDENGKIVKRTVKLTLPKKE